MYIYIYKYIYTYKLININVSNLASALGQDDDGDGSHRRARQRQLVRVVERVRDDEPRGASVDHGDARPRELHYRTIHNKLCDPTPTVSVGSRVNPNDSEAVLDVWLGLSPRHWPVSTTATHGRESSTIAPFTISCATRHLRKRVTFIVIHASIYMYMIYDVLLYIAKYLYYMYLEIGRESARRARRSR